jgi:hypothetical protein
MRWEDERYVRLYTRDTVTWKLLPWQAKCLIPLLMRKLDRQGIADVGSDGLAGIAVLTDLPLELVEAAWPELVKRGVFTLESGRVSMPNYMAAQEARSSAAERQRRYRESQRNRDTESDDTGVTRDVTRDADHNASVTRDAHNVTGHNAVTPSLAQPSLAQPSLAQPSLAQPSLAQPSQSNIDLVATGGRPPSRPTRPEREDLGAFALSPAARVVADVIGSDPDLSPICKRPNSLASDLVANAPGLDVAAEVRAAGAWIRAHPSRKKHNGNQFLLGWVRRGQDRVGGCGTTPLPLGPSVDMAAELEAEIARREERGGAGRGSMF